MIRLITIVKRSGDYMACMNGDASMFGTGKSPYEAIGNLVNAFHKELGITIVKLLE